MKKLHTSKTFLKMSDERMDTPHPIPLAISYENHQKSLVYFSHLVLIGIDKKGVAMAQ